MRLRFATVDGLASLVWLANQAAIELHPFLWRVERPRQERDSRRLDEARRRAGIEVEDELLRLARPLVEELGLEPYVKTSGSLGLHVQARLREPLDTKRAARHLAERLAEERPNEVVAEMRREARRGKVFVDWLQNDVTRQTVAPYSLRGLAYPAVATPVRWEEVERAEAEGRPDCLVFTRSDILERVERDGDLFSALR